VAGIRAGVMGIGWPGRMHTEGLSKLRGVTVAAVAEPDEHRRSEYVAQYGPMAEYKDYRAMLRKADIDAAAVALPTSMHHRACVDALKAGCHVICEKPPTTTAREMIEIARLARKKKLTYMFARQPRFRPDALVARRLVQKKKIGHVYHAESSWIRCRDIPWGKGGWFVDKKKGGGVLLDLGVHMIDNAWFVMGCPRPVEAFAGTHVAFDDLAPPGVSYTAEDMATGMLRFENGATLTFTVTFALNTVGPVSDGVKGHVNPQWGTVKIYGKKGGIDVWGKKLAMGRRDGVVVSDIKMPKNAPGGFDAQAKEFARAIRAGDEPMNSPAQAVMLMQMLDALKKSGETRRSVRIPKVSV